MDPQRDREPFRNGPKKYYKASKNTVSECSLKGEVAKKNLACGGPSIPPAILFTNHINLLERSRHFGKRKKAQKKAQ